MDFVLLEEAGRLDNSNDASSTVVLEASTHPRAIDFLGPQVARRRTQSEQTGKSRPGELSQALKAEK